MSVLDFIQGPRVLLGDVGKLCFQACSEAYGMTNSTPCAFGCQSQLPSIEMRRNQIAKMSLDEDDGRGWMSLSDYSSRMMTCLMDQMTHRARYGWIMISSSSSDGNSVVVVQGSPVYVGVRAEYNPETKTSDYLETNLARVDGGATPDVKRSQIMSMEFVASRVNSQEGVAKSADRQAYEAYDWFSCLSAKTGLSKMSILFLCLTLLIVFVWFFVGICFPARQRDISSEQQFQKLSIYGDMDYLTPIDSKSLVFPTDQKFTGYTAAPIIKMPLQEI
jgi:hypothetical protein